MATKYIILIILGVLFMVYNVLFNPEDRGGYVSGLSQLVRLVISMIITLILAVITLIIF